MSNQKIKYVLVVHLKSKQKLIYVYDTEEIRKNEHDFIWSILFTKLKKHDTDSPCFFNWGGTIINLNEVTHITEEYIVQ